MFFTRFWPSIWPSIWPSKGVFFVFNRFQRCFKSVYASRVGIPIHLLHPAPLKHHKAALKRLLTIFAAILWYRPDKVKVGFKYPAVVSQKIKLELKDV